MAGKERILRLTPAKKSSNAKILAAIAKGKKPRAVVKVKFTDAAGNTATKKFKATLK